METKEIQIKTLLLCVATMLCIEAGMHLALLYSKWNSMIILGLTRLFETTLVLLTVMHFENGLSSIGLASSNIIMGIRKGLIWSVGFGVIVFSAFFVLFLFRIDTLALIRTPLPSRQTEILLFFAVGGIIAPIAEETFFRGILYGFFRRWGVPVAIVLSTSLFVLPHLESSGFPVTQVIGGILFATAYEMEGSLMVPMMIHALGNMAIFSFSLLP